MFNITDAAGQRCADKLVRANATEDQCMRLFMEKGKPSMRLSAPKVGEAVFKHKKRNVLVVSQEVAEELDGRALDWRKTPEGPRFRFIREPSDD
ncbi:MAG TPA: hypothetical protein VGM03_14310 [Phycisphaerae bacterium]|jgi:Fe-S cluster assembly iron-binding protein IscA